jgi:hypothetical protein
VRNGKEEEDDDDDDDDDDDAFTFRNAYRDYRTLPGI